MKTNDRTRAFSWLVVLYLVFFMCPIILRGQEKKNSFEVYGYIMTDGGYNFNSSDPDWFDVMRPTKLPKYKNQFGADGSFFISVRRTRVGVRSITQTKFGELKTQFDFDQFGFGKDAGQTTLHVVNAFGQLGKFLAGQTPSTFMDTEVFPVTLDYWGPCSRVFFLNIQVRYTPIQTDKQRFAVALERPGATADGYDYSGSVDISNVKPRLPLPNLATHYRRNWSWGHTQLATILKYLEWKDVSDTAQPDLSGSDIGWGVNFSTVVNATPGLKIKFQAGAGEGVQNYTADPSPDVALDSDGERAQGKALPILGAFLFAEVDVSARVKSSFGYSAMNIENGSLQSPDAFRRGQYALVNLRVYPAENVLIGAEYQFGRRQNFSDGFSSVGNKIQCSFKYSFSHKR